VTREVPDATGAVVAGVDETPESAAAVEWAAEEAVRRSVPLLVLHAGGRTPRPVHPAEQLLARVAAELRARERVPEFRAEAVERDPVTALLEVSQRAALVVVGSRGLGAVAGFVLGSVSTRLVGRSVGPVVVCRGTRPEPPGGGDVLLALKRLADPDAPVLQAAFAEAALRGLPLRVLHVRHTPLPPSPLQPLSPEETEPDLGEMSRLTEALRPWRQRWPAVPVREVVEAGTPARALVDAAETAALVVTGRGERRGLLGPRLGPVVHAALHHSRAPVVVVPHP
jgi:nucleotide-binding universal stress UspA family protein